MSLWSRLFPGLTLAMRAQEAVDGTRPLVLPPRDALPDATDREAVGLIPVYRALQVLTTSAAQLTITAERQGSRVTGQQPPLVRRPDPEMDRSDWIEQAILCLALDGNVFVQKVRNPDSTTAAARILPPREVTVTRDPATRRITYHHQGQRYTDADIRHQTLMRLPGELRGIGPIQAARRELGAAMDLRDYSSNWFRGTGQPSGILTVEKALSAADAREARDRWNEAAADPLNPSGVRVLGSGTIYRPLVLAPEDAQWLEARTFSVTEIARLFGIPSALMLVALEGSSLTYSNVEQEWIAFVRFTLLGYIRKLEELLTELSPAGQTIRFNLETLLRSDTATRYGAHEIGLRAGFLTIDEVREIEGLPPLTAAQRAQLPTTLQESPA